MLNCLTFIRHKLFYENRKIFIDSDNVIIVQEVFLKSKLVDQKGAIN